MQETLGMGAGEASLLIGEAGVGSLFGTVVLASLGISHTRIGYRRPKT